MADIKHADVVQNYLQPPVAFSSKLYQHPYSRALDFFNMKALSSEILMTRKGLLFAFLTLNLVSFDCISSDRNITVWVGESENEFSVQYHSVLEDSLKNNGRFSFRIYEYGRALLDFNSEKPTCLFNRRISSIFDNAKYSIPITKYKSRELFFRKETSHDLSKVLNDKGLVDLKKLFATYPDRVLLLGHGLTYGDSLDLEIKNITSKNIYFRVATGHLGAYIKMLMQGKVDYIIEYRISFENLQIKDSDYASLRISPEEYTTGHVVCNKHTPVEIITAYEQAYRSNHEKIIQVKKEFNMIYD